jgi:hypothetical protein
MQKADGSFMLALWNEIDVWNEASRTNAPGAAVPVTLSIGQGVDSVKVYDPLTGTAPIQTSGSAQSIKISLPDHPIIIEIDTNGTAGSIFTPPGKDVAYSDGSYER